MDLAAIEVGKSYPGNYHQEGVRLEYDSAFTLYVFLPNITEKEAQVFRTGPYRFALAEKEGVLFFLCEFKGAISMSDAPFHFGLYQDGRVKYLPIEIPESQGVALSVIVVDNYTGIVQAYRFIGLSHRLSLKLLDICRKQSKQAIDRNAYYEKIAWVQRNYTSHDLYEFRLVECKG